MKILQLTDSHLFKDDTRKIRGVASNQRYYHAIKHIKDKSLPFDYIFLTGDMSEDMSAESYQILVDTLAPFNKPIYWIPGNHDNELIMRDVLAQSTFFNAVDEITLEGWVFVFLNTVKSGWKAELLNFINKSDPHGLLNTEKLQHLHNILSKLPKNLPTCLVMHHHPHPVGTPLIDQYVLEQREKFWQTLTASNRKIDMIMCGHVHGDYDFTFADIRIISSAATCLQWKKGATKLSIEDHGGFTLWTFGKNNEFSYERFIVE